MNQNKGKHKNKLDGALLDTSIQFERIKYEGFEKNIDKLNGQFRLFSSHYSIYEFKTGIILSLIKYYLLVEKCGNVSNALSEWSEKYGRQTKYVLILQSVLQRTTDSIPSTTEIKKYLMMVEAAILDIQMQFQNKLIDVVGSFGSDDIVRFEIIDRNSYQEFYDAYHNRDVLPMVEFWKRNNQYLNTLIGSNDFKNNKNYADMYSRLKSIQDDVNNSEKLKRVNWGVGDAIIAIDCPKKHTLITLDSLFELLCPLLNKKYLKYPKHQNTKKEI